MLRFSEVRGLRMAYREAGSGPPIVFLHGNPTSSYLWRNVLGPLAHHGRCLAPVSWQGENAPDPELFGPLRTDAGERLVLRDNVFVEKVLPAGTQRALTDEEMAAYRAPYLQPGESRRPTLTWPREIPIDGHPADVAAVVTANAEWMAASPVPKLFINGDPGALLTGPLRERCRGWPNQREVTVPGLHFLPEDAPRQIAEALDDWITVLSR